MLKKFYICVIFVMQIIMAECQQLYGYTSTDCTRPPSFDIDIGTDNCYSFDTFNIGSFSYDNGGKDDFFLTQWDGSGCDMSAGFLHWQARCITVNGNLDVSFAAVNSTGILELIGLRVAAISKTTEIIARNCLCSKY